MPAANNKGVRIHYEIEGAGPPLILHHGWSNSLEYWRDFGYVEALKRRYRLILIDARGHGQSDIPESEGDYDAEIMASDVLAVLDALKIDRAHFMGYSMGGWIGFHLGMGSPERFLSMIIGGAHPYPEDLSDMREIPKQGAASILEYWDDVGAPLSSAARHTLAHQLAFPLAAIVRKDRPDLSQWLHKMRMPTLIYAGDQDYRYEGVKDCVKDLPNATWVSLPGLDHLAAMARSDIVLPQLCAFLDRVNATAE